MKIVTTQFDLEGSYTFKRLLDVYKMSVQQQMPEAEFVEMRLEAPDKRDDRKWGFTSNTFKLDKWVEFMEECDDNVIFTDCDMLMLRDASHAFDVDFDVAYTKKIFDVPYSMCPVNNGVIFARPTEGARAFFRLWAEVNRKMYDEPEFHNKWIRRYPGMNQAAFGYLLEEGKFDAKLHAYSTVEWNAIEQDWPHIDDDTVFLHMKGSIRNVASNRRPFGRHAHVMLKWYNAAGIDMRQHKPPDLAMLQLLRKKKFDAEQKRIKEEVHG